jgi:hypothetical protein
VPFPVVLHVYDVSTSGAVSFVNRGLRRIGGGAYHAGVEVLGQEWSYGGCDAGTGVFSNEPKLCDMHIYRESVEMGDSPLTEGQIVALIEAFEASWPGNEYDLLNHNCQSFAEAFLKELQVPNEFPKWIKRTTRVGASISNGAKSVASGVKSTGAAIGKTLSGLVNKK